ncbi:hypothetical protein [Methanosarcina horonobensis]|uniref:hypothetical protein n=1 Tax=Methanosarcina horonobensis TaxID=418008 RepID=UPI0022B8B5E7|nr:hypothetical protein [Methanosarcina horonobensis]
MRPTHAIRAHLPHLSKEASHPFPRGAQDSGSLPEIAPFSPSFFPFRPFSLKAMAYLH